MTLFDRLRDRRDFTDTDRAIADFVTAHPDLAANMNIGELSVTTHTSNAAVTRFSHRLGLEGYRALRLELTRELERARLHVFDVNPDLPFMEGIDTKGVMEAVLGLTKQALDETSQSIDADEVNKAAHMISEARRVAVYGTGDTGVSAEGFMNLLLKVDIACLQGSRHDDNLVVANVLGANDVALFVTYSGILFPQLRVPIEELRSRGCKAIAITAFERPEEYIPDIECVVRLPLRETRRGRIATYYSQTSIRYALNCIYGEIFTRNWQASLAAHDRYSIQEQWED